MSVEPCSEALETPNSIVREQWGNVFNLTPEFKKSWVFPDPEVPEPKRSRLEILDEMTLPEQVEVMRRSNVSEETFDHWLFCIGVSCFELRDSSKEEVFQAVLEEHERRVAWDNRPPPTQINLNEVIVMAEYKPAAINPISSDLTYEQRLERRGEWSGMIWRVARRIRGLDLPLAMAPSALLVEHGWPGVLEELKKVAHENNIKVVYGPASLG